MKGKQLVTPQRKRIRCEIYTCKKMSGFSIGLKGHAPAYRNVCPECMDEIVRQAGVLLYGEGWTPEAGLAGTMTAPADITAEGLDEPVDALNVEDDITGPTGEEVAPAEQDESTGDPLSDESESAPEANASTPADNDDYYVCKDCGAKFQKPSGKMEYISHRRTCPKKQEGE